VKVALFVHCFFPAHFYGTETYTLALARNLRMLGHEPVVVTAVFPGEPVQQQLVDEAEFEGIPVVSIDKNRFPNTRVKDTYYQPQIAPVLDEILGRIRPDIVHVTHLINHTAALLEVVARRAIPAVATFTDFFGFCYNNRLEAVDGSLCAGPNRRRTNCLACHLKADAEWRPREPGSPLMRTAIGANLASRAMFAMQRVPGFDRGELAGRVRDVTDRALLLGALYPVYRRVIAPTTFLRDAYERNGLGARMTTIRFGVDIDRREKPVRAPGAPLTIGFIGQIAPHKGTDLLIEAAARALDPARYRLLIYGSPDQDPAYMARLRARAHGLPIEFKGTFAPARMRAVLDPLDYVVIPSRWYENGPLVLLNALASHTPVVVSNVEGMTEFVQHERNGHVFERGNAASLARTLARMAETLPDHRRMVERTHFVDTTETMTRETLDVYRQALDAAGAAAPAREPMLLGEIR
jgi:glycosyltransferase involved in cell wall biosynthesis